MSCCKGLFEVTGAASSVLSVFGRRRRHKSHISPTIRSAPQTPPTIPPAIAPLFVEVEVGIGVEEVVEVGVGVGVEEAVAELAIFWCISFLILTSKRRN